MSSVWSDLLLRLLAAVLAGLTFALALGAAAGLLVFGGALLLLLVAHAAQLARLRRWLGAPQERTVPEARGAWGEAFVDLHRLLRCEAKAQAGIRAELELFRQATRALPDGVVLLDEQGRIVWCNDMAERHLGIELARDAGLILLQLVRLPGFAEFLAAGERGALFTCRPAQTPGLTLSLEVIPFEAKRRMVISFDVTQIERAETMRRDFIANISHELRTPLTVVSGFLEHLAEDAAEERAPARRHLALMDDQVRRMRRLVDDLLTLSRLEDADQTPRDDQVNMPELLEGLLAEGRGLSAGRHALTLEACPCGLRGSREELRSAFSNLVSNAVRYTPEGGRIALRWEIEEGRGVFSVADSGIGIAEEHIPRLTERFYRVDRGRSRESGGTGLGLAIVKHVLLRHQATLDIRSRTGEGSVFRTVFPAWRMPAPAPAAAPVS